VSKFNAHVAPSIPELPDTFWSYLAAFIDGEGSITMCQNGPRLILTNTDKASLDWIQSSLTCGYLQEHKRQKMSTRPCYGLSFGSRPIRLILPKVIPFLKIKKRKAEILLEYLNTVVPRGGSNYHTNFDELRQRVKTAMASA
jgi:hypothetical protein